MPKPATYAELWETYDQAILAMRELVYVSHDAAAEFQDMAPKLGIELGSMSDQIDLERIFAAIRAANAAIDKRNEMARL